jgi:hypothetical protein
VANALRHITDNIPYVSNEQFWYGNRKCFRRQSEESFHWNYSDWRESQSCAQRQRDGLIAGKWKFAFLNRDLIADSLLSHHLSQQQSKLLLSLPSFWMSVYTCFLVDLCPHSQFSIEERSFSENVHSHCCSMRWRLVHYIWAQRIRLQRCRLSPSLNNSVC